MRPLWLCFLWTGAALAATSPEPFSHKRHAPLKLDCNYCHAADKSARATLPAVDRCLTCHKDMERTVEFTVKLHRLPDFIFFSHARHLQARVACTACHVAAYEHDRPQPGAALKMKTCVDCHKSSRAKNTCEACHELAQ